MHCGNQSMPATRANQPPAQLRWYPRDISQARAAYWPLTLEERGALISLEDLLAADGWLPDDDRYLAGCLRVDLRVWKRLRRRLVELGQLAEGAGELELPRVGAVLEQSRARLAGSRPTCAPSYAAKSVPVSQEINNLAAPLRETEEYPPSPPASRGDPDPYFAQVAAAWPKPGKPELVRAHWQGKVAAGADPAELARRCLAHAARGKPMLLSSFLRSLDLSAGPPQAAPVAGDPLGEVRLGAIMRGEGDAAGAVARAVAALGVGAVQTIAQRARAAGLDRIGAWEAVCRAVRAAGSGGRA